MSIDARLAELGITLPQAAAPVAAYVSSVEANGLLHISGQISLAPDGLMTGRLGEDRELDYGVAAARICGRYCARRWSAAPRWRPSSAARARSASPLRVTARPTRAPFSKR